MDQSPKGNEDQSSPPRTFLQVLSPKWTNRRKAMKTPSMERANALFT
ncbi:MAG: hypothetical protein ACP5TE_14355 [Verrucomicrobiia bacterium]